MMTMLPRTEKIANLLRKSSKDERVTILGQIGALFCSDCGGETPDNPDADDAPELSLRCRCVIWADE